MLSFPARRLDYYYSFVASITFLELKAKQTKKVGVAPVI